MEKFVSAAARVPVTEKLCQELVIDMAVLATPPHIK
jgi:hypothetical protein